MRGASIRCIDSHVHGHHNATNRKHPHLTFIDAGIVTELTGQDRRNFVDLFYAIATGTGGTRQSFLHLPICVLCILKALQML